MANHDQPRPSAVGQDRLRQEFPRRKHVYVDEKGKLHVLDEDERAKNRDGMTEMKWNTWAVSMSDPGVGENERHGPHGGK